MNERLLVQLDPMVVVYAVWPTKLLQSNDYLTQNHYQSVSKIFLNARLQFEFLTGMTILPILLVFRDATQKEIQQ